jgi:hypothetical protein
LISGVRPKKNPARQAQAQGRGRHMLFDQHNTGTTMLNKQGLSQPCCMAAAFHCKTQSDSLPPAGPPSAHTIDPSPQAHPAPTPLPPLLQASTQPLNRSSSSHPILSFLPHLRGRP